MWSVEYKMDWYIESYRKLTDWKDSPDLRGVYIPQMARRINSGCPIAFSVSTQKGKYETDIERIN